MNWCSSCSNRGEELCLECQMSMHDKPSGFVRKIENVDDRISECADVIYINRPCMWMSWADCQDIAESLQTVYPRDLVSFESLKFAIDEIRKELKNAEEADILTMAFYRAVFENGRN